MDAVSDHERFMAWIKEHGKTPHGFLTLVLPGQITFLAAALIAAALSRVPIGRRLGLTRPSTPWWGILLLLPATMFAALAGDVLTTALFGADRGEHLKMLYDLFRGHSAAMLALIVLTVGLLPGVGEELLFRGYTQGRLLQRWHPALAIGFTSLIFALAHFDLVHSIGVLPLGIWLGVVAWLSGSVWPAVICHAANNTLAVLATNAGIDEMTERVQADGPGVTLIVVTGTFVAISVLVMLRYRERAADQTTPSTAPPGG
jgi:membrane protease YdiL (CAAX protease family)